MRINTNVMALNAQNKLSNNQAKVEKSIQKLSSGLRINSAADDAAGLAISEKMRAQIRGLDQAQDNAQDGISLIQTAEGALQQTTDILQRMRELVIKAQNTGVLTEDDRTSITEEMSRKFLTKTGRTQGQRILYFDKPFELIPVTNLADIADKFTRNEIMSPNEIRQIVGLKPIQDAKADELRNRNLNEQTDQEVANTQMDNTTENVNEYSAEKTLYIPDTES